MYRIISNKIGIVKYQDNHRTMTPLKNNSLQVENQHYQRLLSGMANAISVKGYGATTIADIVAQATVSRRTFYEHFDSKAECLIALYESLNLEGLNILVRQLKPKLHWREQVHDALLAYFSWMANNPVLMRTLFIDILALGTDGLKVRRRVNDQITDFIFLTVNKSKRNISPISRELSVALVGGIHELVLQQIEAGEMSNPAHLAKVGAEFVRRVFHAKSD